MPALMPTPANANTPVIGMEPPMTISSAPCASTDSGGVSAAAPAVAAAPSISWRRRMEVLVLPMSVSLLVVAKCSVAEGPKVEEPARAAPHFCEPQRLEDQKSDDQRAEDHQAHRREEDRQLDAAGQ